MRRVILISTLVALLVGCGATCPTTTASTTAATSGAETRVVFARAPSDTPPIQQQPVLPQPSPRAAVEQTVGVANVRVDYSSPGARGRTIWGELVPYGQVWRAGANQPTRIDLSEDATILGTRVPAGVYSLFVIPAQTGEWTIILNTDSQLRGAQAHDPSEDVARGSVSAGDVPARERLTYSFDDTTESSTSLVLDWAGKRVAIPIEFDTAAIVGSRIDATVGNAWRPHFNAGRYLLEQEGQQARALEMLERSVAIQSTWWNEWFLARALDANGRRPEAIPHAERALELGAGDQTFDGFFAPQVRTALEEWRR
ncbi:DUF2911 domain-containing protein [Sandaracinus amylolyticus]|uniref:DUF2911 domain-containing protein n=1 Tax=Sandaracinus amylolyticus TaxID=927083 RepID=UPI001F45D0BF|nr:DUF2911 domain-containing protein [Sandaracinus amylolyticus]UJR83966.1 Hypothetical protein I5071_60370 [Sandaracinus amylolyticus]